MISFNQDQTHYDLLELSPDASPSEIRSAYLRAKAAYRKDSVALYSLISEEETQELLSRIEEAYQILSNPERRKDYDRNHGLIDPASEELPQVRSVRHQKIVSIDRVPPMDSRASEEAVLIPPVTDIPVEDSQPAEAVSRAHSQPQTESHGSPLSDEVTREICAETQWSGSFLKKIREARKLSLEETTEITKINKNYVIAIEEENFSKLPAAVFLRGFIIQMAKLLKLPHDKVAASYMARYEQFKAQSNAKK